MLLSESFIIPDFLACTGMKSYTFCQICSKLDLAIMPKFHKYSISIIHYFPFSFSFSLSHILLVLLFLNIIQTGMCHISNFYSPFLYNIFMLSNDYMHNSNIFFHGLSALVVFIVRCICIVYTCLYRNYFYNKIKIMM